MTEISENQQAVLDEWDRFQVQLPELMTSMPGRWIVFKDDKVLSDHETEEIAFEAAIERLGTEEPFIVAQAAKENPATVLFRE